jgi:hypothetical protein
MARGYLPFNTRLTGAVEDR